ncbi:MAG: aldo/keto reductase [Candidatus Aminicenantes bacterium]|nr:aldo/keto reductase [Candidatus Aminicenantes bacterium]
MKKNTGQMTRKEFLKTSSVVLLGLGVLGTGRKKVSGQEASGLVKLGQTGIEVSRIGFGASRTMEPSLVDAAIESGFTFLDTGRSYTNGRNEVMIGEVLGTRRKEVVIQSKVKVNLNRQKDGSFSPDDIKKTLSDMTASMDASLKALRTDYIDIMLIHGVEDPGIAFNESIMKFFESAKKEGKIRAHGFSAHIHQIELLQAAIKNPFYKVIMVPYNHKGAYTHMNTGSYSEWDQPSLEIEMDKAKKQGVGLLAMKTCSGGPYSPDGKTPPTYENALRWILAQNKVDSLAVAMGNFEQMEESLRALL